MENHSITTLFRDLMNLVESNDAFEYKDARSIGGGLYRAFSYRLASYSDFLLPGAVECRGVLFEIDESGQMIRCAARPQSKFFNAYENPLVMFPATVLSTEIALAMTKLDGSIISTFVDNDSVIRTKSHTSMHSDHAYNSTALLHGNDELYGAVVEAEEQGCTVNFEYTSPEYRIVLPYQEDALTVLNIRHRDSGEMIFGEEMKKRFPILYRHSVFAKYGDIDKTFPMHHTLRDSINAAYDMKDIEGFVLQLKDGTMCKVKTHWYCALHLSKDSINIDSRLYDVVLQDGSDDLRQMFSNDPYCLNKIDRMEKLVFSTHNKLKQTVEDFVKANKHLERKEFALVVQRDLPKELNHQGLAFSLYNGKTADYKEVMLKYMKDVLANF